MDERSITKVKDLEDPNRCQSVVGGTNAGQCLNIAVPGGENCMVHGGNKQLDKIEKESCEMYQVDIFKARIARMKGNGEVKSLSNEVAILRMMLEGIMNSCANDTDLLLHANKISDLVIKIDKLVVSCHKLEKNLGQHLDKSALLQFAAEVVTLISETVKDKDEVAEVADGILKIIGSNTGDES